MNIPIKKHTKVRRPMSRWQLEYMLFENNPVLVSNTLKMSVPPIKVNDISKGLQDPIYVGSDFMEAIRNPKIISTYPERVPGTKPSLLTRVRERFKR